jgi:hypothetical protein
MNDALASPLTALCSRAGKTVMKASELSFKNKKGERARKEVKNKWR